MVGDARFNLSLGTSNTAKDMAVPVALSVEGLSDPLYWNLVTAYRNVEDRVENVAQPRSGNLSTRGDYITNESATNYTDCAR